MVNQKQSNLITLGLWLVGLYGGVVLAYLWEPSSTVRASILFCMALSFIPLFIWQVLQRLPVFIDNLSNMWMAVIGVVAVVGLVIVLDVIVGLTADIKLALVFIGFMVYAGILAWETVQHGWLMTLPAWLMGGLAAGVLTGEIADLSQSEMVRQSAIIIAFSIVMAIAAMTGQLEAGVNSVLSTEPPSEGESAIR